MTARALGAAVLLVVLSNAILAWRALDNRAATDAALTLTENELPLVSGDAQNTAFAVRLRWEWPAGLDLSADQAAALGFGPSVVQALRARTVLPGGVMPRRGWAVFEPATTGQVPGTSALRVLDVGPDRDALATRYPDRTRHLILRVEVGVTWRPVDDRAAAPAPRQLSLRVMAVVPDVIAVPRDLRPVFEGLPSPKPGPPSPRYRATIHWGRNREPWMAAASRLP